MSNVWETRNRLIFEYLEKLATQLSGGGPIVSAMLEEQTVQLLAGVVMLLRQHRVSKRGLYSPGRIPVASSTSRMLTMRASAATSSSTSLILSLFLRQAVPGRQYGSLTCYAPNFLLNEIIGSFATARDLAKFFLPLIAQLDAFDG